MRANIPLKRHPRLSVAVPASLVSDVPHLREKTLKIGWIGRALALFRVDEIIIFPDIPDQNQTPDLEMIATVLSYMETPQYLRKHLFKIKPELRYAGVLPPLRTLHHPLEDRKRDLRVGEYREGVVTSISKKGIRVDIGVEHPIHVFGAAAKIDTRVTVKIVEAGKHPRAELVNAESIKTYWGYRVTVSEHPFGRMVKDRAFDLVIATTRQGESFTRIADELSAKWQESKSVLVAFGSPTLGLQEIVRREGSDLNELVDFMVNTVPDQATKTVRTEEALYATLTALNLRMLESSLASS